LLIVGEGRHEEAFLKHVKQLFVQREGDLKVTLKQAGGKGAQHVIDWTVRQTANTSYDQVAALLDTDADWNASVAKKAKQKKITVLTSDTCLEAMLLRILGKEPIGDAKSLKKQFAPYVNQDATCHENYAEHFGKDRLLAARATEPTIDTLLKLLGSEGE
jgi:hypothetical protein